MIIVATCAAALVIGLCLFGAFHQGANVDEAHADFPTYEPDVPADRWDDPAMDLHIATAIAIGHGADAVAIQRSIERSQAAVKGLLASRDELAKKRGAKR